MSELIGNSVPPIGVLARKPKPKLSLNPKHAERVCWGCEKYCSADDLRCGNGTIRTQHPIELFGEDWLEWGLDTQSESTPGREPRA